METAPELDAESVKTPEYVFGREKVKEFAAAIRNSHPAHWHVLTAQKLGYRDVVVAPTMSAVIAAAWQKEIFSILKPELDISKILHAGQKFIYHKVLTAGDKVVMLASLADTRKLGGIEFMQVHSKVVKTSGELMVEIFATFATQIDLELNPDLPELIKGVVPYGAV